MAGEIALLVVLLVGAVALITWATVGRVRRSSGTVVRFPDTQQRKAA